MHPLRRTLFHIGRRLAHRRYLALAVVSLAAALEVSGCELARPPRPTSATGTAAPATLLNGQTLSFYDPPPAERDVVASSLVRAEPRLLARPAPNEAKPSPWAIPESVYFVYRSGQTGSGGSARQPLATAFVLSVPDRRQRDFARFLVTARHVVDPRWARCSDTNPASIDLRLNRRSGGVGYETIWLETNGRRRFFTPSDPAADVAIMLLDQSLISNIDQYKFIDVPFRMLPTQTELRQLRTSQPVITARAVARPAGESANFPVFDGGILAKMPAEAVNVQCGTATELQPRTTLLHLWLINAGAPQGLGGAPVYTAIARGSEAAKTPVLLGIQSVAWPDHGVAGITPSTVLEELIQTALPEHGAALDFYQGPTLVPKETAPSLY